MAPKRGEFVSLAGGNRLHLSVSLQYEIVETDDPQRGPWKIKTREYRYHVVTDDHAEVILFHWHPDSPGERRQPHLHMGRSQLMSDAVLTHSTHVPTGRVSLEAVIRLLVTDFGVVPRRSDWDLLLTETERNFVTWRTWH